MTLRRSHKPPTPAQLTAIRRRLTAMYGRREPPLRRPRGLDMLVEAMLSQNTNMANAVRGYRALRREFDTWTKVMNAPVEQVQREISICGLARMRARRLQALLRQVKQERRRLDIEFLGDLPIDDAYAWLTRFHGIGPKTAAFVCLFSFGMPVLPIDNGVLRVVRRLRLVRAKAKDAEAERTLSPHVPVGRHYELHVLLFTHAKQRCRPKNPKCDECTLLPACAYGQRRMKHHPPPEPEPLALSKRQRLRILSNYVSAGIARRGDEPAEQPREF